MSYLGRSISRDMYFGAKPILFRMAERMRKNPTEAEKILWNYIKRFRLEGFIFRRQHPIDFYIADFYCHKLKLIVEVDGEIHKTDQAIENDDGRTGELERFGIKVIRFTNEEVLNNHELVIKQIKEYMNEPASPSSPGRGGYEGVRLSKCRERGTGGGEAPISLPS